jgi:hypothetical protein
MKKQQATGKIKYKLFWNWDHSTTWCLNVPGSQDYGVGNYYTKPAEIFAKDFKRMIDFAAAHQIDAIGIVGLMRDAHGGEEMARRLCGYARENGVRIYLIAGLYSYGGLYYEGDNPLSLERFLANNPDCIGREIGGVPARVPRSTAHTKIETCGCPSNKKLRNFVLDSLDIVFGMVPELGGIQMEVGDSWLGLCMCEKCRERRDAMQGERIRMPGFFLSDMADIYPEAARVIRNRSKDAWVICEMYGHFLNNPAYERPEVPAMQELLKLPEDTFLQWGDRRLDWDAWEKNCKLPEVFRKYHHIVRCHHGSQWRGGRNSLAVAGIRKQCRYSYLSGVQAVSLFGESSPYHTNSEFNYLAMKYFADYPLASLEQFASEVLAPLLGGSGEQAMKYLEFADLTQSPEKIPAAVNELAKIIGKQKDVGAICRWSYLTSYLNSFLYEHTQQIAVKSGKQINLDFL